MVSPSASAVVISKPFLPSLYHLWCVNDDGTFTLTVGKLLAASVVKVKSVQSPQAVPSYAAICNVWVPVLLSPLILNVLKADDANS